MSLKHIQKTFEDSSKRDPLYAVLSNKGKEHNNWDVGEFFATGRKEIAKAMQLLSDLGVEINKGRALDFGCAV